MFGVGVPELLVIFIVALVVLGPERIPEVARALGKALAELRKATGGLTGEFREFQDLFQQESNAIRRSTVPRPRPPMPPQPETVGAAPAPNTAPAPSAAPAAEAAPQPPNPSAKPGEP